MKGLFIGFILLVILMTLGYFGFRALSLKSIKQPSYTTSPVTLTGVLQKAKGEDYNFIIIGGGKSTGVASYSVKLDEYVGKNVEITGQYSGTTLYADHLKLAP